MMALPFAIAILGALAAPPDPNRVRIEPPPPPTIVQASPQVVRPYRKFVRRMIRERKLYELRQENMRKEIARLRTAAYMPSSDFHARCERVVEFADKHGLNPGDIVTEEIQEIEDRYNEQERKAKAVPPSQFALTTSRFAE